MIILSTEANTRKKAQVLPPVALKVASSKSMFARASAYTSIKQPDFTFSIQIIFC